MIRLSNILIRVLGVRQKDQWGVSRGELECWKTRIQRLTLNFLVFCPLWRKVESIYLKLVSYQLSVGGSKSMCELLKLLTRWRVTSSAFLCLSASSNLWNSDEFYWFFACPRESYQGKFCFSNMIFVLLINYCYLPCSIIHRDNPCCDFTERIANLFAKIAQE